MGDVLDRRSRGGFEIRPDRIGDRQKRDLDHIVGNAQYFGRFLLVIEVQGRETGAETACA